MQHISQASQELLSVETPRQTQHLKGYFKHFGTFPELHIALTLQSITFPYLDNGLNHYFSTLVARGAPELHSFISFQAVTPDSGQGTNLF